MKVFQDLVIRVELSAQEVREILAKTIYIETGVVFHPDNINIRAAGNFVGSAWAQKKEKG